MAHERTGDKRGRPRRGEIRPATPGGIKSAEYRARQKRDNPEYLLQQALYQQLWRLMNKERWIEIQRDSHLRSKRWKKVHLRISGKSI
jgi:hypothetical protein